MTASADIAALTARLEALEALVAERAPHPCRCNVCVGERLRQAQIAKEAQRQKPLHDFRTLPAAEFAPWFAGLSEHQKRIILQDLEPEIIGNRLAELDAAGQGLILDHVNDRQRAERAVFAAIKVERWFVVKAYGGEGFVHTPAVPAAKYPGFRLSAGEAHGPEKESVWKRRLVADKPLAALVQAGTVTTHPIPEREARHRALCEWLDLADHKRPSLRALLEAGKF